eukprot:3336237-Amphidinium_carterae.1
MGLDVPAGAKRRHHRRFRCSRPGIVATPATRDASHLWGSYSDDLQHAEHGCSHVLYHSKVQHAVCVQDHLYTHLADVPATRVRNEGLSRVEEQLHETPQVLLSNRVKYLQALLTGQFPKHRRVHVLKG